MEKETEAAVFSTPAEAEMAASFLESSGIKARIQSDTGGGIIPGQLFVQGIKILVAEEDLEAARQVLQKTPGQGLEGTVWKCAQCGEAIEIQFTECWSCGSSRSLV